MKTVPLMSRFVPLISSESISSLLPSMVILVLPGLVDGFTARLAL
jgi:hypothetical protein